MTALIIAVVVAFLANGEMNYAAVDAKDDADCRAHVAQIAHDRLVQNATESVKVLAFEFKCVEFEAPPSLPAPKHVPTKDEA